MDGPCKNTDRELWRDPDEGNGSFYADSIHVTESGGIGINVGGHVIVKPLRDWHALGKQVFDRDAVIEECAKVCDDLRRADYSAESPDWVAGAEDCAKAIRALAK